jgi:hypothetical protein
MVYSLLRSFVKKLQRLQAAVLLILCQKTPDKIFLGPVAQYSPNADDPYNFLCVFRYNFSKIAQYKQLTLEEAEEKMNRRRNSASGYERWMMKAAANGAAAFSSGAKKLDNVNGGTTDGVQPKKGDRNEEWDQSDKGEEDEEGRTARKNMHRLTTKGMEEDDEEGTKDRDFDLDDEIEKGILVK